MRRQALFHITKLTSYANAMEEDANEIEFGEIVKSAHITQAQCRH